MFAVGVLRTTGLNRRGSCLNFKEICFRCGGEKETCKWVWLQHVVTAVLRFKVHVIVNLPRELKSDFYREWCYDFGSSLPWNTCNCVCVNEWDVGFCEDTCNVLMIKPGPKKTFVRPKKSLCRSISLPQVSFQTFFAAFSHCSFLFMLTSGRGSFRHQIFSLSKKKYARKCLYLHCGNCDNRRTFPRSLLIAWSLFEGGWWISLVSSVGAELDWIELLCRLQAFRCTMAWR